MKKLQNSLFVALTATVLMTGCGGEDSKNDSPNTSDINKNIDDKTKIDKSFQASLFLKKLGNSGEELNDGVTFWKIVEIPEIGLMIKANSFIELTKKYTQYEAKEYCKNLQFAEFYDWRLPTPDETRTMLDVISYSEIEYQYFPSEVAYAFKMGKRSYDLSGSYSFIFFTNYFEPAKNSNYKLYGQGRFGNVQSNTYGWSSHQGSFKSDINDTTGRNTPTHSVLCVRN